MSATQKLIAVVEELVGFNGEAKAQLQQIASELEAEQASIADLSKRVAALEGASAPTGNAALEARVAALEARNGADDTAAEELPDEEAAPAPALAPDQVGAPVPEGPTPIAEEPVAVDPALESPATPAPEEPVA